MSSAFGFSSFFGCAESVPNKSFPAGFSAAGAGAVASDLAGGAAGAGGVAEFVDSVADFEVFSSVCPNPGGGPTPLAGAAAGAGAAALGGALFAAAGGGVEP